MWRVSHATVPPAPDTTTRRTAPDHATDRLAPYATTPTPSSSRLPSHHRRPRRIPTRAPDPEFYIYI